MEIFKLNEIQAKLNNDEALLYLINNAAFQGFVVTKENFESFKKTSILC